MATVERRSEEDPRVKLLAPLGEMVGVQKALQGLIVQRQALTNEAVLEILRSQQQTYSTTRGFEKKAYTLGEIIKGFEEEALGVDDVLRAAGVQKPETRTNGDVLKNRGWLGRLRGK